MRLPARLETLTSQRDSGIGWRSPRGAVIGASLIGMAALGLTSLLQTGRIRHLPDPPLRGFDSDRVNLSPAAFPLGIPDGLIGFADFALNIPFALAGGADRARSHPWIVIAAAAKATLDAIVSGWFFMRMPTQEHAWCAYCIVAAFANFAVLGFSLPEARRAWHTLRR